MKLILGSGLVGLLARKILGAEYKIIPFGKSRFYSYNPALQDNYLAYNESYFDIIKPYLNSTFRHTYKMAWSVGGMLHNKFDDGIYQDWTAKLFGKNVPPQSSSVMKTRFELELSDIRLNQLYAKLQQEYESEIKNQFALGDPISIRDGRVHFAKSAIDYNTIVSTIPLDVLAGLVGKSISAPAADIHYLHVQTSKLDFEGHHQVLVSDASIDFYKVTAVAPNRYLFYFNKELQNPGLYLLNIIGQDFDILDGTSIKRALPAGQMPDLSALEQIGIYAIGATAQWDWCLDAGSAMLRILNFANTGQPITFKRSQ
jgi:hypothetical protein